MARFPTPGEDLSLTLAEDQKVTSESTMQFHPKRASFRVLRTAIQDLEIKLIELQETHHIQVLNITIDIRWNRAVAVLAVTER